MSSFQFLVSNSAYGNEYGRVDGDSKVEECANDLLHKVDGFGGQKGGIFVLVGILEDSAIGGLVPGMRGVLGVGGCWMLDLWRPYWMYVVMKMSQLLLL